MVKTLPSSAGGAGSIPGRGAKIPHGSRPNNQNIKQKQYCNKFNKDLKKKMVHIKKKEKEKRLSVQSSGKPTRDGQAPGTGNRRKLLPTPGGRGDIGSRYCNWESSSWSSRRGPPNGGRGPAGRKPGCLSLASQRARVLVNVGTGDSFLGYRTG